MGRGSEGSNINLPECMINHNEGLGALPSHLAASDHGVFVADNICELAFSIRCRDKSSGTAYLTLGTVP